MQDHFKQNLLSLRNPPKATTFGEALLGFYPWTARLRGVVKPAPALPPVSKEDFSEKKQVIESLERFAQEKTVELNSPIIKFDGGEVVVKAEPGWNDVPLAQSLDELMGGLSLPTELLELLLKNKTPGKIQAFFVTENFRNWDEVKPELKGGFIDELLAGFPLKTAELFERMIMAMKLTTDEVLVYPIEGSSEEEDYSVEVMQLAAYFKPMVIITLGAKATNKILKGNDRLSVIHGQFNKRNVQGAGSFNIVPLFHPSIIESNQNMKKTAWSDMQKIMQFLKKLP